MKYICTEREDGTQDVFTLAEVLGIIKNHTTGNWGRVFRTPISAGFITKGGTCYGESITLNLGSRHQEDTDLLARQHRS